MFKRFFTYPVFFKILLFIIWSALFGSLLKHHYTGGKNSLTHYQDSYFGEMVNQLCQNGKSSVVAYINDTKSNASNEVFQKKVVYFQLYWAILQVFLI